MLSFLVVHTQFLHSPTRFPYVNARFQLGFQRDLRSLIPSYSVRLRLPYPAEHPTAQAQRAHLKAVMQQLSPACSVCRT